MNRTTTPENHSSALPTGSLDPGYRLAVRIAWVGGVFSVVVCALLLANYSRREAKDPLGSQELKVLKAELHQQARNEELKKQIRQLDLRLRKEYFRQRRFSEIGAWLLLAAVVVCLVAAKSAATLRRKLPTPEPQLRAQDKETQTTRTARWSVAGVAVVLVVGAIALSTSFRSGLPSTTEQLAALIGSEPPGTPDYPSDEEIRRNWPRFRGPGGLGISNHADVPVSWDGSSGQGILWKTPVPLPGNNSPVLWDDRVFLTGATEDRRQVYCFDANTGKLLWQKDVPARGQSTAKPPQVAEQTGYAAPTTTTDGRRVFAIFANGDVAAFDFQGNLVWAKSLGIPDSAYGHASSLCMYRNLLLIQFDQGGTADEQKSKLLALDAASGQTVYQVPRPVPNSWTTPCLAMVAGRVQLVTCADPWVIAYDPTDGSEIWRAKCLSSDCGPSPVVVDAVAQVGNEYCQWSAIRADGEGDVTDTHVLWQGEDGLPDTASPLATNEYVFLLASYGILTCYDAKSGDFLWDEEFEDATFTSSPSLVGNRVYLFDEEGRSWIVEPGREGCQRIGQAALGEPCVTSPAFRGGRIYIRGKQHLFCIGRK